MRRFQTVVLSLVILGLLVAAPAQATLIVVSDGAGTLVPNIPGYLKAVAIDQVTIRAGIQAAVVAGDSVYVDAMVGTSERVIAGDWAANNVVVYFNQDKTSVVWNSSSSTTGMVTPSTTITGVEVVNAQFTRVTKDHLFVNLTTGTGNITFTSCDFTGLAGQDLYATTGISASNITFDECTFTPTGAAATLSTMWVRAYVDDVTFTNCTFDFRGLTITANNIMLKIAGGHGWTFTDCIFYDPVQSGSGASYTVSAEASTVYISGDFEFTRCTFITPATTSTGQHIVIAFGRSTQAVDSVLVQGCVFSGDNSDGISAIKMENPGSADNRADRGAIIGNTFSGYHISIGILEASRETIVAGNRIIGAASDANDVGIYFQDARFCQASDNWITDVERGIQWANGSTSQYENRGHVVTANYFERCVYPFYIQAATQDSLSVRKGNYISGSNTNIAYVAGAVKTTIAQWQAVSVAGLSSWQLNGQGDTIVQSGDIDGALRVSGVLKIMSWGSGGYRGN